MRTSWFFGRRLADELAANDTVMPIGLISSNYENTKIEWWADPNVRGGTRQMLLLLLSPYIGGHDPR